MKKDKKNTDSWIGINLRFISILSMLFIARTMKKKKKTNNKRMKKRPEYANMLQSNQIGCKLEYFICIRCVSLFHTRIHHIKDTRWRSTHSIHLFWFSVLLCVNPDVEKIRFEFTVQCSVFEFVRMIIRWSRRSEGDRTELNSTFQSQYILVPFLDSMYGLKEKYPTRIAVRRRKHVNEKRKMKFNVKLSMYRRANANSYQHFELIWEREKEKKSMNKQISSLFS